MALTNQPQYDIPKDSYFAIEDTSFVSGDSPVTHDINASIGRNGIDGYISCDGTGDIKVTISEDGTTFGDSITIKLGETFNLRSLSIDSIKVTHSGTDTAYRVFVV